MKILLFHQYFKEPFPGGPIRSWYLSQALVQRGHHVVVITASNEKEYLIKSVDGIEVHYLPVPYDNRFGFYARSVSFFRYAWRAARLAGKFRDFNICYGISVPLTIGLIMRWVKFRYHIPYIFEVGDLWPEAPVQLGFIRNPILKSLLYRMERKIYGQANAIVALSPSIKEAIEKLVPGKAVHLIPNMADTEFYKPENKNPTIETRLGVSGKFVISYIGAFGFANGLEFVVKCAEDCLAKRLPIQFILCGDGAMKRSLEDEVRTRKLSNLSILPYSDRDGVREILHVTDAVFVCYKNVPILETGSPNKFFDGLAAGKLIILNFGGWLLKEVEENNCGLRVQHPGDLAEKLNPFITNTEKLIQYQRSARALADKKYSREKLSAEFASFFKEDQVSFR